MTTAQSIGTPPRPASWRIHDVTLKALIGVVWASAAIFGLYIVVFYAGAVPASSMQDWNRVLPRLYEPQTPLATAGIAMHFLAGGILLALGPIQLIGSVRRRWPRLHRWIGWTYGGAALAAGIGGLVFIGIKGTVGGTPMNIGFGLYGALMTVAAVQTVRYARRRREPGGLDRHRAWAIRLFVLAIGSWLYRMYYGFWFLTTGGVGTTSTFTGPFDVVMVFFFYLPNLVVAEAVIRGGRSDASPAVRLTAAAVFAAATMFFVVATYFFTRFDWGPSILQRLV